MPHTRLYVAVSIEPEQMYGAFQLQLHAAKSLPPSPPLPDAQRSRSNGEAAKARCLQAVKSLPPSSLPNYTEEPEQRRGGQGTVPAGFPGF